MDPLLTVMQLVSNLAVIATVGVVLYQIVQARRAAQSQAEAQQTNEANAFFLHLAGDPALALIWRQGRTDPRRLSDAEQVRFYYLCVAWFLHHETTYRHYGRGVATGDYAACWSSALAADMTQPGLRSYWGAERGFYHPPFRALIDELVRTHDEDPAGSLPFAAPSVEPLSSGT